MDRQLQYYQKNTHEAFDDGFTCRTEYECIESEVYEVYKYYLPLHALKKIRWVKNYFEKLDGQNIDIVFKRRKHWIEYAETAFLMLMRINTLITKGNTIIAGSQYVSPIPWAIFGEGNPSRMARAQFSNIIEIANHYRSYLHGNCYPIDFHFRIGSSWAQKLSNKFSKSPLSSPNFWMTVALLLTYDLIHNCGPDCNEFFELFSNDYREHKDNFNVVSWEILRCKILGVPDKVEIPPPRKIQYGEFVGPVEIQKAFKYKTEISLISESQNLAANEKTFPTIIKVEKQPNSERFPRDPNINVCQPRIPIDFYTELGVNRHRKFQFGNNFDMLDI